MKPTSPYNGSLTREQFLFHEMRITARLMDEGLSEVELLERISANNLFQYPTERMVSSIAKSCMTRLRAMDDPGLISIIAYRPAEEAKQVCLYAMMKHHRIVWDFMITVIGEKYRLSDLSYSRMELNTFFTRLQEQDDSVAAWSDKTVQKIKQVLNRVLVTNEYLDSLKADRLNPVWLYPTLEAAIREHGDSVALPAFNCLE